LARHRRRDPPLAGGLLQPEQRAAAVIGKEIVTVVLERELRGAAIPPVEPGADRRNPDIVIVDVEGWNEPRGKCSGATAVRGVSLVPRPAEIASRRRGRGQQVDLLVSILAHVRDPEIAGGRVEMEPE